MLVDNFLLPIKNNLLEKQEKMSKRERKEKGAFKFQNHSFYNKMEKREGGGVIYKLKNAC